MLGKGNRIPVPDCVLRAIRILWPDVDDMYMGHESELELNKEWYGGILDCRCAFVSSFSVLLRI